MSLYNHIAFSTRKLVGLCCKSKVHRSLSSIRQLYVGTCRLHDDTSTTRLENTENENESKVFQESCKNEDVKSKILLAALDFVPQYGWKIEALVHGAGAIGLSPSAHGMFQHGEVELVNFFVETCNGKLAQHLSNSPLQQKSRPSAITEYIRAALQHRLRMLLPYKESWDQGLSLLIQPTNVLHSTKQLLSMADDIWYYAGDRSTDSTWYTKRVAIATVYGAAQLALLQDNSEDFTETWQFLARRMEQLEQFQSQSTQMQSFFSGIPDFINASIITFQNIVGLRK